VSDITFLKRAQIELAYFSGYARLRERHAGGAGDGRQRSLRVMRVLLSGVIFPSVRPTRSAKL
jgi:hypothetical protein